MRGGGSGNGEEHKDPWFKLVEAKTAGYKYRFPENRGLLGHSTGLFSENSPSNKENEQMGFRRKPDNCLFFQWG